MPGLTEQERAEILARRQGGGTSTGSTPGSFSPFPGMEVQGMTIGKSPSIRLGQPKASGENNPDARRIVSQATAARAQIAQIWDEADKLIPATESSGTKAITSGIANRVGTAVGLNEPARAFRQTLKAKLRNVARSLGERGVITDKDIEDFVASMPDFTDSTVSRPIKKENLLGGVDALVNAFTQKTYGVPFAPTTQNTSIGGIQEGQTATNPKTGARMVYRGGQWQPVQ